VNSVSWARFRNKSLCKDRIPVAPWLHGRLVLTGIHGDCINLLEIGPGGIGQGVDVGTIRAGLT